MSFKRWAIFALAAGVASGVPAAEEDPHALDLEALRREYYRHEARGSVTCKGLDGVVGVCEDEAAPEVRILVTSDEDAWRLLRRFGAEYRRRFGVGPRQPVPQPFAFTKVGGFVALGDLAVAARDESPRRPASIGVSIGRANGGTGTLGCRLRGADDQLRLLSNWHVLYSSTCGVDCPVYQPSLFDSRRATQIGWLEDFEPVLSLPETNRIDAAVARTRPADVGRSSPDGAIRPASPPSVVETGDVVRKHGRTTGATAGRVFCTNATICVVYGKEYRRFAGQILVVPEESKEDFCRGGDSGALVVDESGTRPVGLLFARQDTRVMRQGIEFDVEDACLANPIDAVLQRFGLEFE